MKKARLFRGLAGIFLAIAVAFSVATSVATAWAGKVDELLGTSKSGIERSTDPEDYRYKSDFSKSGDLVAAEIAYATRVSAEGSVALKGTPAVEGTKVTLFGMRSGSKMQFGGTMGELVEASQAVTLADGRSEVRWLSAAARFRKSRNNRGFRSREWNQQHHLSSAHRFPWRFRC